MAQDTFLARMQPVLDAMPEGPDKDKLFALIESQDTLERGDTSPKDRARAMRRLTQIDRVADARTANPAGRGRPWKP